MVKMFFWGLFSLFLIQTYGYKTIIQELVSFASLNYTWDSTHLYSEYVKSNKFIVENNLLAGINVDRNSNIYVSVPRWKSGVPATLNKLVWQDGNYLLEPFPSWDMQREGVEGDLQNVQSMTIDENDVMWVIDVGRRNFFETDMDPIDGPAGILKIDLKTNLIIDTYTFDDDVVSYNNSFLNDIVVDTARNVAYFSDAWGDGAVIVLDLNSREAKRYSGVSTQNDPSYRMVIDNHHYGNKIFTTPIDGIALSEDKNALFWCQVQGTTLYRISTDVLRNNVSNEVFDDAAVNIGSKDPSDGMKYLNGTLYWGSLPESTVYSMPINATSSADISADSFAIAATDAEHMQWVDTFAVDLSTNTRIYFVSNKLNIWTTNQMNFEEDGNMHIMYFEV